jgi:metal-dependent HD superfamily phosphatase/phosphodiesterase
MIELESGNNALLAKVIDSINTSSEITTLWKVTNVTAINRLGMTDHGISHFSIVATNGLKIARLLQKENIEFSVTQDYGLSNQYAEVIIVLACLLHDLGMSIHRNDHELYSLFLTNTLLREMLVDFTPEIKTIVISEVLHAIISHRSDGSPLTIEAGIVRVADALDMSGGRTRLPYDESKLDIHSVSALAIDEIEIVEGTAKPVQINIVMNHTAGLFQVDELLKKKVASSGIEQLLEVKVFIDRGNGRQHFKDLSKLKR